MTILMNVLVRMPTQDDELLHMDKIECSNFNLVPTKTKIIKETNSPLYAFDIENLEETRKYWWVHAERI